MNNGTDFGPLQLEYGTGTGTGNNTNNSNTVFLTGKDNTLNGNGKNKSMNKNSKWEGLDEFQKLDLQLKEHLDQKRKEGLLLEIVKDPKNKGTYSNTNTNTNSISNTGIDRMMIGGSVGGPEGGQGIEMGRKMERERKKELVFSERQEEEIRYLESLSFTRTQIVSPSISPSISLRVKGLYSILVGSFFMWSGALDSSGVLLLYSIISLV